MSVHESLGARQTLCTFYSVFTSWLLKAWIESPPLTRAIMNSIRAFYTRHSASTTRSGISQRRPKFNAAESGRHRHQWKRHRRRLLQQMLPKRGPSACPSVRLSHPCTPLNPLDRMRCHSAKTLAWPHITFLLIPQIFHSCKKRKQFTLFCGHLCRLLPNLLWLSLILLTEKSS